MTSTHEQQEHAAPQDREYRPFVQEVTRRGIGKTKAYELANAGLIDTFLIGRIRFVYLDSLAALPQRLAEAQRDGKAGAA